MYKKVCCTCKVVFLLIRPTYFLALSRITRFYVTLIEGRGLVLYIFIDTKRSFCGFFFSTSKISQLNVETDRNLFLTFLVFSLVKYQRRQKVQRAAKIMLTV